MTNELESIALSELFVQSELVQLQDALGLSMAFSLRSFAVRCLQQHQLQLPMEWQT